MPRTSRILVICFPRFSVTMEHHCALKVAKHQFKNKSYYHQPIWVKADNIVCIVSKVDRQKESDGVSCQDVLEIYI